MEDGSLCESRRSNSKRGKGRKERLKSKIEALCKEKEDIQRKSEVLAKTNLELKRSLLTITTKKGVKRKRHTSSSLFGSFCTTSCKPSFTAEVITRNSLRNIRIFDEKDVSIDRSSILGKGVFGKCFVGAIGPQKACIKVIRKDPWYKASFTNEANILSHCYHPNISLLFGIFSTSNGYDCLVMSIHTLNGIPCTVQSFIEEENEFTKDVCFRKILLGIVKGLEYLHSHCKGSILHNDLKCDNIVVDNSSDFVEPRIIDFGKACFECNAKQYQLSKFEKEKYKLRHPQVAPDVRDGIKKQSKASDIYSFGRILSNINEKKPIPASLSIMDKCMQYNSNARPLTHDLCNFFENLCD